MQVWPTTDDFAHGAAVYGTNVVGYLGARPRTAGGYQYGSLGNGYGTGSAAAKAQDGAQVSGDPAGFMRRQYFPAEVRVRLASRKHAVVGTALAEHLVRHGVLARITGGTIAQNGTTGVSYEDLTCYALLATYESALPGLRFRIVRFDAGVQTVLATLDDTAHAVGDFASDVELRLDVTTVAGDVLLQAYVTNVAGDANSAQVVQQAGGSGAQQIATPLAGKVGTPLVPVSHFTAPNAGGLYVKPATAQLVLSYTDTSGSKITADGRAGFLLDCEKAYTSPAVASIVSLASFFEVTDLTTPAAPSVVWRDEWKRAAPIFGGAFTDKFGTAHRRLSSDYSCDQNSSEATNILRRSTTEEAAIAPLTVDLGEAVRLNGTDEYLELQNPWNTYPAPALPSAAAFSVAVWCKLDTAVAGEAHPLYQGRTTSPPESAGGINFRLTVNGSGDIHHHLLMWKPGGLSVTVSGDFFDPTNYVGQAWCYVMTYKANAYPATGEGRVRFYVGRLGLATLVSEHVVAADDRPIWDTVSTHFLGRDESGPPGFLDGTLDELSVFYDELTAGEVAQVCSETADPVSFQSMGLVAGWHFDEYTDVGGASGKRWAPYFSAVAGGVSADPDDWFREVATVSVVTGLVPVYPGSAFVALAQRPADSAVDQHRSVRFKAAGDTSVGGLIVRASPGSTQGVFTGYRLDAAPGNPARIALYRVIAGVQTLMAQQDPDSGTAVITVGSYAALSLQVQQRADGGPFGPVQLTPRLGGTLIPMVTAEAGVTLVDLDGNVIDTSGDRIVSGPAEGFHGFVDGLGNHFDDFAQGSLSGPTAADAAPNYPIPEEADDATGDLADVLEVDWALDMRIPAPRVGASMESGHETRWAVDDYERRRLPMRKVGCTDAEVDALRTFWDDHQGGVIPFAWDPSPFAEEQQAGVWRFVEDSLADSYDRFGARVTTFELEEVRASE